MYNEGIVYTIYCNSNYSFTIITKIIDLILTVLKHKKEYLREPSNRRSSDSCTETLTFIFKRVKRSVVCSIVGLFSF